MNYHKVIFITVLVLLVMVVIMFIGGTFMTKEAPLVEESPVAVVEEVAPVAREESTPAPFATSSRLLFTAPAKENGEARTGLFELADDSLDFTYIERYLGATSIFINNYPPQDFRNGQLKYSKRYDGTTAYSVQEEGSWYVVSGDEKFGPYENEIDNLDFLPDGRLVFSTKRGDQWYLVLDGVETAAPGSLSDIDVLSSPTGEIAYKAHKIIGATDPHGPNNLFYVVDGKTHNSYYEIKDVEYSNDGAVFAYVATYYEFPQKGLRQAIVLNGIEGPWYQAIASPIILSPTGDKVTYIATKADRDKRVVFNGLEGKSYEEINNLTVSPDGDHLAYTAVRGDSLYVVRDRREVAEYPALYKAGSLVFNQDGSRLAYQVEKITNEVTVVVDKYKNFSTTTTATSEGKFVVVDDNLSETYDVVYSDLSFSADGQHFAYVAGDKDKIYVVIDGNKVGSYKTNSSAEPAVVFSPDSQHYAYAVNKTASSSQILSGATIVLDGQPVGELIFDHVYRVWFSPDSNYLGVVYQKGNEFWYDALPVRAEEQVTDEQ